MEAQVSLTVAFRSSALLGLVSLIFLLTIPHRFYIGFRSAPAKSRMCGEKCKEAQEEPASCLKFV